jgi:hypothetical protein
VYCSGSTVKLLWYEPYDSSGIDRYLVTLQYYDYNSNLITIIDRQTVYQTELDITNEVMSYCGSYLAWTVTAIDSEGAQGDWSQLTTFYADFPPPTNAPPPAPDVIFPVSSPEFSCPSPSTPIRFEWGQPYDPSGIDHYEFILYYFNYSSGTWIELFRGSVYATIYDTSSYVRCGEDHAWAVRAIDSEGSVGDWSPWYKFYVYDEGPH